MDMSVVNHLRLSALAVLGNKLLAWDILVTSLMLKTTKKSCNLMNRPPLIWMVIFRKDKIQHYIKQITNCCGIVEAEEDNYPS